MIDMKIDTEANYKKLRLAVLALAANLALAAVGYLIVSLVHIDVGDNSPWFILGLIIMLALLPMTAIAFLGSIVGFVYGLIGLFTKGASSQRKGLAIAGVLLACANAAALYAFMSAHAAK